MAGFQSEAQRRKFQELLKQGAISKAEYDRLESQTSNVIPDRVPLKEKQATKTLLRKKHYSV